MNLLKAKIYASNRELEVTGQPRGKGTPVSACKPGGTPQDGHSAQFSWSVLER